MGKVSGLCRRGLDGRGRAGARLTERPGLKVEVLEKYVTRRTETETRSEVGKVLALLLLASDKMCN